MIINGLKIERNDGENNPRCPKYVYKIDRRDPKYVFENGFTAWGSNDDFFAYVAGFLNNYQLPETFRSSLISVSSSIDSVCSNFINSLVSSSSDKKFYLYKIRANDKFYNTTKTMMHYLPTLVNNADSTDASFKFSENIFKFFTQNFIWQNDWFKIGNISNENIFSARQIDVFNWNDELTGKSIDANESYKNMKISEDEEINIYYKDADTVGNAKPWIPSKFDIKKYINRENNDSSDEDSIFYKKTLYPSPKLYLSNSYWNIHSMISSVTPTPSLQQPDFEREELELAKINDFKEELEGFNHSNLPHQLYEVHEWEIKDSDSRIRKDFDNIEYSGLTFVNHDCSRKYKAHFQLSNNGASFLGVKLVSDSKSELSLSQNTSTNLVHAYYDVFSRLTFRNDNYPVTISIGPIINQFTWDTMFWRMGCLIQSVNDDIQKWTYEIFKEVKDGSGNTTQLLIRLLPVYKKYDGLGLVVKKEKWENSDDYPVYLARTSSVTQDPKFEELFLLVSRNDTSLKMLHKQTSFEEFVDLNLRYLIKETSYTINMYDKGTWSYIKKVYNQFFYDLRRKRIYWIDNKLNVYALYNNRNDWDNWNWIEWKQIHDLDDNNDDPRYKWYFLYKGDTEDHEGAKEARWIKSYYKNDWLKVASGTHFGQLFTSKYEEDNYSEKTFLIDENIYI